MRKKNDLRKRLLTDIQLARKKFECYEKIYTGLSEKGKKYVQAQSKKYKSKVANIQQKISPSINKNCPTCINCCKLHTPELSIYIAGSIGCFEFVDYILVRCDTVLPNPNFENIKNNLCPFWDEGCVLPNDCRSFLCTQYFCDKLKREINMEDISENLNVLESLIKNFSIQECLGLNTHSQSKNVD